MNFRFERNPHQDTLSKNHVVIRGKKTRGQYRTKSGFKLYAHLSDRSDPYGLFNVLKDFCKLTKPLRKLCDPQEARNIFIYLTATSSHQIGCFGPASNHSNLVRSSSQSCAPVAIFLQKHEVFDSPGVRITEMAFEQLRTSYETVLEDMGLPLYVRQKLLGQSSMDISMHYGSDSHATKLQMDKLGVILDEIHETYKPARFFQGAILTAENDPRRRTGANGKVFHFAYKDWQDNFIMLCENAKSPTWPGHQHYIKKGVKCSFLARCLFCKRSLIGKETLPHLASWDQDIHDYFYEEADYDSDLKFLELQQAIRDVFEQWSLEVSQEDVDWAKAKAMSGDFQPVALDVWNIGGLSPEE